MNKSWSKISGYIIFGFSMICWGLILVVPFLGFSTARLAGITTGLVIAGEITFYLSIFLIGKEFMVKIKNKFKFRKSKISAKSIDSTIPEDQNK